MGWLLEPLKGPDACGPPRAGCGRTAWGVACKQLALVPTCLPPAHHPPTHPPPLAAATALWGLIVATIATFHSVIGPWALGLLLPYLAWVRPRRALAMRGSLRAGQLQCGAAIMGREATPPWRGPLLPPVNCMRAHARAARGALRPLACSRWPAPAAAAPLRRTVHGGRRSCCSYHSASPVQSSLGFPPSPPTYPPPLQVSFASALTIWIWRNNPKQVGALRLRNWAHGPVRAGQPRRLQTLLLPPAACGVGSTRQPCGGILKVARPPRCATPQGADGGAVAAEGTNQESLLDN